MAKKKPPAAPVPPENLAADDPVAEPAPAPQDKAQLFLAAFADRIEEIREQNRREMAAALDEKRASLDAGNAVPHDKRPV